MDKFLEKYNLPKLNQEEIENMKKKKKKKTQALKLKLGFKNSKQGFPWWSSGEDCIPNAGGLSLILGQGTRSHIPQQLGVFMLQLRVCMP